MDLPSAAQLANALIAEHGLDRTGWTFAFNRRKRALGLCRYNEKRIELSHYFVADNDAPAVRETVLHEIAHALAGHKAKHGPGWVAVCRKIGAKPEATCSTAVMPKGAWQATCPSCNQVCSMHRKPMDGRKYNCRKCGSTQGRLRFRHVRELSTKGD